MAPNPAALISLKTSSTQVFPAQPTGIARPLGGLEHFFSLIDQHRSVHFAMTAHIEGRTTIAAWRKALRALQERHPLLSVGIVWNNGCGPFFRRIAKAPIPLRIPANSSQFHWQIETARELVTPFHPPQAPLVRAVLLHRAEECFFILTAHHSIGDGLSLTYAVRDVIRALSGEILEPLPLMPQQEFLLQASNETLSGRQAAPPQSVPPQTGRAVRFRAVDGSLPYIEARQFSPELTRRVIEFSRKEKTTVHGALCAALAVAGRELSSDWSNAPVRILSPFNLRKQIGVGEDCGLFVWAGISSIESGTLTNFWDMARAAKASVTTAQSLDRVALEMAGLADALGPGVDVHTASQIYAQTFPCELLLTNLGNLPCNFTFGDLKLKALWGPAVLMGFHGEQTVGVTTTNGSLCLLHSSFQPIRSLLQRTERILGSL